MTARAWLLLAVLAVGIGFSALTWLRCETELPRIDAPAELVVGSAGREVEIRASDEGTGLVEASARLVHAGGEVVLLEQRLDARRWPIVGGGRPEATLSVSIDPKALELRDGDAFLHVRARDASWWHALRGSEASLEVPVRIDLVPPRLQLESGLTYVRRGGAAAVVYRVSEPVERQGVEVGDAFFRGFALPGENGAGSRHVAIFAVPVDAPADPRVAAVAVDAAQNRAASRVPARVLEVELPTVRIQLSQSFLEGKVVELARTLGIDASDPLQAFQEINTTQRERDEARIRELSRTRNGERRFEGAFEQLRNSKVTSRFAERRQYFYEGRSVSEATHYGFDLATYAGGPVTASNRGVVIHAGDLGIYGQCVLLDHGLGLVTLYGHLSEIGVQVDETVEKGQEIGRSGQTGFAGGDHLHFALLIDGVYADPVEWWDEKWVREHFEVRVASAEGR